MRRGTCLQLGFLIALCWSSLLYGGSDVIASKDQPAIKAVRYGRVLTLHFNAAPSSAPTVDRTKPPKFAIYQGERKLHDGIFAYG